jgi:hypothetical protein
VWWSKNGQAISYPGTAQVWTFHTSEDNGWQMEAVRPYPWCGGYVDAKACKLVNPADPKPMDYRHYGWAGPVVLVNARLRVAEAATVDVVAVLAAVHGQPQSAPGIDGTAVRGGDLSAAEGAHDGRQQAEMVALRCGSTDTAGQAAMSIRTA